MRHFVYLYSYARNMGVITDVERVQAFRYEPHWPLGEDISQQITQAQIRLKKRRRISSASVGKVFNGS